MKRKSNAITMTPISETQLWLAVLAVMVMMFLIRIVDNVCTGSEFYHTAPRMAGAVSANLLAWGVYRQFSRRDTDRFLITNMGMLVLSIGSSNEDQHHSFLGSFLFCLVVNLLTFSSLGFILKWAFLLWPGSAKPSQSDHPLYDADVDGAAGRLAFEPRRE